jgi:hypothetical protein
MPLKRLLPSRDDIFIASAINAEMYLLRKSAFSVAPAITKTLGMQINEFQTHNRQVKAERRLRGACRYRPRRTGPISEGVGRLERAIFY